MSWRPLWGGVRARAVPAAFPQILEETHPSPSPERWQQLCPQGVSLIRCGFPHCPLVCGMWLQVPSAQGEGRGGLCLSRPCLSPSGCGVLVPPKAPLLTQGWEKQVKYGVDMAFRKKNWS